MVDEQQAAPQTQALELDWREQNAGLFLLLGNAIILWVCLGLGTSFRYAQLGGKVVRACDPAHGQGLAALARVAHWEAARLGLYLAAGVVLLMAVRGLTISARGGAGTRVALLVMVCAPLLFDATRADPAGFLTNLLKPFQGCEVKTCGASCMDLVARVQWPRMVGHGVGVVGAAGLTSLIMFGKRLERSELRRRIALLRQLFFATSAFFVAGVLTTDAAFRWVVAHWRAKDGSALDAAELISGGLNHAAITYSAILLGVLFGVRFTVAHLGERFASADGFAPHSKESADVIADLSLGSLRQTVGEMMAVLAPLLAGTLGELVKA